MAFILPAEKETGFLTVIATASSQNTKPLPAITAQSGVPACSHADNCS